MRSARINFGLPASEYIMEVDDTGAAVSCRNQDTNTEYVGGIPTYNIKIEMYDTGADELVNYTFLDIAYFDTDEDSEGNFGLYYAYVGMAPEDHIYKAPVIGDKISFEGESGQISVGDGDNAWFTDPDADMIRSVSGSALKDNDHTVTITGDCTITINVIQD